MKNRIVYLDLARAMCVIWIVGILHVIGYVMDPDGIPEIIIKLLESITVSSLATFTFLSGYFVAGKSVHGIHDILLFYKKRLIRFALLYTLACVSLYLAGVILNNPVRWFSSFNQLVATLFGVSGLIPDYQPATFWYFSMIILFYLVSPLIMSARSISRKILMSLVVFVILLVETVVINADVRLPFYFVFYVCGVFCVHDIRFTVKRIIPLLILFLSLSIAINLKYYLALQNFIIGIMGTILILSVSMKISKTKIVPFLSFIAYGSMCTYLFHRHLYSFVKKIYEGDFWPIYICPIVIVIVFIGGYIIQLFYDKLLNRILLNQNN